MNTQVTFELAKLLKEKGFKKPLSSENSYWTANGHSVQHYKWFNPEELIDYIDALTIAEVVMWLYEKYGIWICVDWMKRIKPYNSGFYCHLRGANKSLNQDNFIVINNTLDSGYEVFNIPTEAYEAAIEYTLNNLI